MMPVFRIPGTLDRTSEDCNTVVSAEYCKDCGKVEARFYHCNNWDCPTCYFWTASRAAHRAEDRLLGTQKAYADVGKHPGRILHVTFSVPESEYDNFDCKQQRKKCYGYAEMIGMLGGAVAFHAHRVKKEYRKPLYDYLKNTGLHGGLWRAVHDNPLNLSSWRDYVYFAPHFHVLGFYPKIVMKSNEFFELTGWTYKTIGVSQDRNVFRTLRYLCTHLAVPEGHDQAITYFGLASYNKTSVEAVKTYSFKACPACGSENYYLIACGEYMFSRYLEGLKPSEDSLLLHVRVVKTIKRFTVRVHQSTIPEVFAIAC